MKSDQYSALLIGVWEYAPDSGWETLNGPRNDVRKLEDLLSSPPAGIFSSVRTLENPGLELNVELQRFLDDSAAGQHLLVYYSGHGEVSEAGQSLRLTNNASMISYLDSSTTSFAELAEWARTSPARSVTIILDCCKAGAGMKDSMPRLEQYFSTGRIAEQTAILDAPQTGESPSAIKELNILAAVPGFRIADDGPDEDAPSPFTRALCEAIETCSAGEGGPLVGLSEVNRELHAMSATGARPVLWGTRGSEPGIAARPDYAIRALATAGLREVALERSGAAIVAGRPVIVETEQAAALANDIAEFHPACGIIADMVGRGKTWTLCALRDHFAEESWTTVTLCPSVDEPDAAALLASLQHCADIWRQDGQPLLLLIDGLEWNEAWGNVVNRIDSHTLNASVVLAVDSRSSSSWRWPNSLTLPAVVRRSGLVRFIERLIAQQQYPELMALDDADRARARKRLTDLAGSDLWAIVHLAPICHHSNVLRIAVESFWDERLKDASDAEIEALQTLAGISLLGGWCPTKDILVAEARWKRLGLEYQPDETHIRITSEFANRAILSRRLQNGKPVYLTRSVQTEKLAQSMVRRFLTACLRSANGQAELFSIVRRLIRSRGRSAGISTIIADMCGPAGRAGSVWGDWTAHWTDLGSVAELILEIRKWLTPLVNQQLEEEFVSQVCEGEADPLDLDGLVPALELTSKRAQSRRSDDQAATAVRLLADLILDRLESSRYPVALRLRTLRILRALNDQTVDAAFASDYGPLLARPSLPPDEEDPFFVLELFSAGERSRARWGSDLAVEATRWPAVIDDQVRRPERGRKARSPVALLGRALLARRLREDQNASQFVDELLLQLRFARPYVIHEVLSRCRKFDPPLALSLAGRLPVAGWSGSTYRTARPGEIGDLLGSLGKLRPDLAVLSLTEVGDGQPDDALADLLADRIRRTGDAVGLGKILKFGGRAEDQLGRLEDGFSKLLANKVGDDFAIQCLKEDGRLTILGYVVEGFVTVRQQLSYQILDTAVDVIEAEIRSSFNERGPLLALLFADDAVLGSAFLDALRNRRGASKERLFEAMLKAHKPSALAGFHTLGELLYPGIQDDFRDRLIEMGEGWPGAPIFSGLARYGNVLEALRGAKAVSSSMITAGSWDAGARILDAFEEGPKRRKWTVRLSDLWDESCSEGLEILRDLDPHRARNTCQSTVQQLTGRLRRLEDNPLAFAELFRAISRAAPSVAETLASRLRSIGTISSACTSLQVETEIFAQIDAVSKLMSAERIAGVELLRPEMIVEVQQQWRSAVPRLTNPRYLALALQACGSWDQNVAAELADAITWKAVRRRAAALNISDAGGLARLINTLWDLGDPHAESLVEPSAISWLLSYGPVKEIAAVHDMVLNSGLASVVGARRCLQDRLNRTGTGLYFRGKRELWQAVGWWAWQAREWDSPLQLPTPSEGRSPRRLPPAEALWAVGWLSDSEWTGEVVDAAFNGIRAHGRRQWDAISACQCLATSLALGKGADLVRAVGEPLLESLKIALSAPVTWLQPLALEFARSVDQGPLLRAVTSWRGSSFALTAWRIESGESQQWRHVNRRTAEGLRQVAQRVA
ncbi:MAG: caspase domain-containing protein [Streptosporangiaceae bacterium]